MSLLTLRVPRCKGRPRPTPLLALAEYVLAAGTSRTLATYALTARRGRALPLATAHAPPGVAGFACIALDSGGSVLAALLADDATIEGERGMESNDASPPAVVVFAAESLRLLARVELRHLPARSTPSTSLMVCRRPYGQPGYLVIHPSVAIVMEPDGSGLRVQRRLMLEAPCPARGLVDTSRPDSNEQSDLALRAPESHPASTFGLHPVHVLISPNGSKEVAQSLFVAICYENGSVAILDMTQVHALEMKRLRATTDLHSVSTGADVVPAAISYGVGEYHILAVSRMVCVPNVTDLVAFALAYEVNVSAAEDVIGESEETRSPPSRWTGTGQPTAPLLQWVLLSGRGENGTCEVIAPVSGIAESLVAKDFPLSCVVPGDGTVNVISRRDRFLSLDPRSHPNCREVFGACAAQAKQAFACQQYVAADCAYPTARVATIRHELAAVPLPIGGFREDIFEIQLMRLGRV